MTKINIQEVDAGEILQLKLKLDESYIVIGVLGFLEDYLTCQAEIYNGVELNSAFTKNRYSNAIVYGLSRIAVIAKYGIEGENVNIDSINASLVETENNLAAYFGNT